MILDSENQSDADKELVQKVQKHRDIAEPYHRKWRENAERRYALYRSHQEFKGDYQSMRANDADEFWAAMRIRFGTHLFIPHSFAVVETIVPRMLSHRPKMLFLPRNQASEQNTENVRELVDAQQEQIQYEMVLQDIAKTGLMYGFGVGKVYWKKEVKKRRKMKKSILPGRGYIPGDRQEYTCFDDPDALSVDPFDFISDPFCSDMRTMGWGLHRTWRDNHYVQVKVESGEWRNIDLADVSEIEPTNSDERDKIWAQRMTASGMGDVETRNNKLHEVWEFWTPHEMITVLDKTIVVASGENPYWHGELPFQVYRPTNVPGELFGIGEIEPMEDLQREINDLRSQRRDNAMLVLNKPFAYWDGLVDPDEIRFGVGSLIPTPGDPRELIRPLDVGDIPGSGYQEESNLLQDIERVTGISDATQGASSTAAETATGAQLIQQAASVRIQNKTRRLEAEVIGRAGKQMLELDQQKIRENREIRIPSPPDMQVEPSQHRWTWRELGPAQLAGEWDVVPEGGATTPDNIPQMRADAQMQQQLLANNPNVDQRRVLTEILRNLGIKQAESFLLPPGPKFPPMDPNAIGQALVQAGMDEKQVQEILQSGEKAAMDQRAISGNAQAEDPEGGSNGNAPNAPQPA